MSKEEFENRRAELFSQLDQLKEDINRINKAIPEIEGIISSVTYETSSDFEEHIDEMFSKLESQLKIIEW